MKKSLLQHYIKLTEFLGRVLGADYEVTLHDLSDRNQSLVAIANGHISGRTVGAPLTNVALQIIASKSYESTNWRLNYRGLSAGKKMLRSSTYYIKDEKGRLIGLLCINFDDSRYQDLSDQVLKLCHPDTFVDTNFQYDADLMRTEVPIPIENETFFDTIGATTGDAVGNTLERLGIARGRLTQEDRQAVVEDLETQGVFLLKGAVKEVADALHCSQASVYRYLSKARQND